MKLYINRFPVRGPWGGGNLWVKAAHELLPKLGHSVVPASDQNSKPDVILVAGLDNDGTGISVEQAIMYKALAAPHRDVKLVIRVNECDARKGTNGVDRALLEVSKHVDGTVFVSRWIQDYFTSKGWACENQAVIVNGVDRDVFKPQPKLNNGKLNVVAHHWSDNPMKGADVYEQIDALVGQHPDKLAFTYVGRHKCKFKHTDVVRPLHGAKLGEELGKHDVYVSASRWDPGPNHCLEALACGLPTYVHRDGGGCVEFAGQAASYASWEDLKSLLLAGSHPTNASGIAIPTWQACIAEYSGFLEATWERASAGAKGSASCLKRS